MNIVSIITTLFTIYSFLILGYILMSWLPGVRESPVGEFLGRLVEPYLSIFRSFIPPLGMIDISPIVALIALRFIEQGVLYILFLILKAL